MASEMENPARAARGNPVVTLAAGKIEPGLYHSPHALQARVLARRFAIAATTAEALAPLVYGEVR